MLLLFAMMIVAVKLERVAAKLAACAGAFARWQEEGLGLVLAMFVFACVCGKILIQQQED